MPIGTIAVSGSIATDHLMRFPGRFADHILIGKLDRLSLSFLVDQLVVHRGGVAANIAYGMGLLGRRPLLIGAVGADFDDYRHRLEDHRVICDEVLVVESAHTGRFTCTTDVDECQIASFHPGAMSQSKTITIAPVHARHEISLILIGACDPDAMITHTRQARELGLDFAADPSQQLPRLDGQQCRELIDGARYLFTNEYEWQLLRERTRWSAEEITRRVGLRVTTLGRAGVEIADRDGLEIRIPAVPAREVLDPTGVGDGFRAGFLSGIDAGLTPQRAAQLGALVAVLVIETEGAQEWSISEAELPRLAAAYGDDAAAEIAPVLQHGRG